ncbi:MAG: Protein kinase [Candidatus Daviesbacteria bacterium GW2011_GWB1_39_5]|nr:MAG: Protein kinase [Candidatus Daviesbacteria bacterium GW2011_GWB1_39_5]OGE22256.1 MAG: hypothetical protein A2778_00265 [Candidatus Daviesbacteria bacterium RIFCSPHIGHO2_01_FULL_40_24]OGE29768.1 MAG: hypothetical protein A3C29_02785 [Candidatus Daviesbacteria bacterium RIFCSPHIGHO2_02_FULL_40_16]OGE43051.1 MAG: hypothetical protein A3A53_01225 [Candidatus Daviesbacteria bacterium RIFCSPLOWO2_01_FULL_39_23]OGE68116.1 MAG: hypothetical protein A3J16_06555 [Candidatus Daviesbacteria bacteriu
MAIQIEHAPRHLPHLPRPDLGEALRWMKDHPVATASAVALVGVPAVAISMYTGRDKGFKPPAQTADSGHVLTIPLPALEPGIVSVKTATPTPSATPLVDKLDAFIAKITETPTPTPTIEIKPYTPTVTPTIGPTKEPTATPTKVSEMTPYDSKVYSGTGNSETKLVNESNISTFYSFVSQEEALRLAKEQPGKLLFPLSPKGSFDLGEYTMKRDGSKIIVAYTPNLDIIASFDGTIEVFPSFMLFKSNRKEADGSYHVVNFGVDEASLESKLTTGNEIKLGVNISKFLGRKPGKVDGDQAEANRFTFAVYKYLDYNPPLVTSNGTKTREVIKITPPLSDKNMWVLKDGKPVIIRE